MTTICINETSKMHLDTYHTIDEWSKKYGDNDGDETFWDFDIRDIFEGSVEPDENIVYWYIDGRVYETDIEYY